MPVPYNFNNSTLNSRRKQSWFARYRVLVVFGAVALVTLIIVLCITNCSSESSDTAKSTSGTAGAGAAVESEPRSDSAPDVSGDSGNSGKVEEAPRQPEITDWYKNEVQYTVKSGDMLRHIVRRHNASERGVIKLNSLTDPNAIRIGQKLRIIPGPWRLVIDSSKNSMTILQNGKIYMRCQVLSKAVPGEYTMAWRQQKNDSKIRKKGAFYLVLRNKQRKLANLELRNNDIQQLLYLLPGGIPVTVTGNK
ncbi:MAG: LysM peptidoglycan-binding domain-containing protein [Lentisphaeria bacterium]|nr:LysM peptidoglycan-binding domain-containing protein [Lentisphaeria bacterium]